MHFALAFPYQNSTSTASHINSTVISCYKLCKAHTLSYTFQQLGTGGLNPTTSG